MFAYRRDDICCAAKSAAAHNRSRARHAGRVPVKYLMDVNVLLAWGWADHVDHQRTARWIRKMRSAKSTTLLTSAIPELGFVRVSFQRTGGMVSIKEAAKTLAGMIASLKSRHAFLADDQQSAGFPAWCLHASRTTDAHLVQLAEAHGAKLVTLDKAIPGAFLIPHAQSTGIK